MAQERWWNWQDDDSTFRLNWKDLGIHEPGRYRGFDGDLNFAPLQLRLHHQTTGVVKTKFDFSLSNKIGVWLSKQGCVVTEDTELIVPISAGNTQPRIDIIVATHEYIQVVGGSPATYSVISGTPSLTPVIPTLPFPTKQVILGQLYVPANMTSLNGVGVVYTQSNIPNFANDNTIVHTYNENNFSKIQTDNYVDLGSTAYDVGTENLIITDEANHFSVLVPQGQQLNDILIKRGTNAPVTAPKGTVVSIRFKHIGGPISAPGGVLAGTPFVIRTHGGGGSNIKSNLGNIFMGYGSNELDIIDDLKYGNNGDVITFRKTDTVWEIISANREIYFARKALDNVDANYVSKGIVWESFTCSFTPSIIALEASRDWFRICRHENGKLIIEFCFGTTSNISAGTQFLTIFGVLPGYVWFKYKPCIIKQNGGGLTQGCLQFVNGSGLASDLEITTLTTIPAGWTIRDVFELII